MRLYVAANASLNLIGVIRTVLKRQSDEVRLRPMAFAVVDQASASETNTLLLRIRTSVAERHNVRSRGTVVTFLTRHLAVITAGFTLIGVDDGPD